MNFSRTDTARIAGVDLAQTHDFSAICITEVLRQGEKPVHRVRHLERLPIGTDYPAQVSRIAEVCRAAGTEELIVDQTGVGRAVVDMMREHGLRPRSVTITAGDNLSSDTVRREYRVPKRDLVTALQLALQTDRLRVAKSLSQAQRWADEMLAFQVSISAAGHDSYGNDGAQAAHDDLVMATALSVWWGERPTYPQIFLT